MPLPLTDGVTAFYGKIAKNILASGDWLTLHHRIMPVVDKPPLTFWLMSVSMAAFGTAEWALRGWHIGLAVGTVWITYALARLALPRPEALLSALILLTTIQFFYQSLVPEQHVPLTFFVTLAVYGFLRWERGARGSAAVLASCAVACAVLSIGLAGLVMPVLIVGGHLVVDHPRLPPRALLVAALAALVFLALAAPWFVVGILRQGRPFADTFFLGGTLGVGRFFHHVQTSPTTVPWWAGFGAYALLVPLGFLPWTGWLWPALRDGWAARREAEPLLWICTLWVIVVLGFLSLSTGDKSSRYILPVLPPLAVLAGHAAGQPRWARRAAAVSLAAALPLLSVVAVVPFWKFPEESQRYAPLFWAFLPAFALALVGSAALTYLGRPRTAIAVLAAMTLLAYGLAMTTLARTWDRISPWRPLARVVNAIPVADARVLVLGEFNEFADYYIDRPVEFVNREALLRAWRRGHVLAIVPEASEALTQPASTLVAVTPSGLALVSNFRLPPWR